MITLFRTSDPRSRLPLSVRSGLAFWPIVGMLTATVALVGTATWFMAGGFGSSNDLDIITRPATVGVFVHNVVERGELESSANVPIRCEVQSRTAGTNGIKILEIVPEGTAVKKGDFLVKFDNAALLSERTTQQINVSTAEAAAAQSKNDLNAAIISQKEYEFGEFETEREKIRGEILVASENASRAEETVDFSEKLSRRGYVSKSRLRSDKFDLAKAKSDLKVASTKLNGLVEFTRAKKMSELEAKTKTCEAKLKADEAKLALEQQKLQVLDNQIAKCVVTAPVDGQVIYDHEQDNWRGAEFQIKQGTVIHEQRVVIRLPDPTKMQVIAKVAESRIDLVKKGMKAKIEIEGLPGSDLEGEVMKVNEYPVSENWFSVNVKEYATTVRVNGSPPGLRPGMTAKVSICVETIPEALTVPIQAVVEHGGKHYCLIRAGQAIEPREVLVGSTNEKFLVVKDGLVPNEQVLMNPRVQLSKVKLPEVAEAAQTKPIAKDKDPKPTKPPEPPGAQVSLAPGR